MLRTFTCIMCPRGCEITVECEPSEKPMNPWDSAIDAAGIKSLTGNSCARGLDYVLQELTNPMRNIATSILVKGGELPLASVRLTKPIPKDRIFDVMAEIRKICAEAPVAEGDIVIHNVLGLGTDVMVTKTVEKLG